MTDIDTVNKSLTVKNLIRGETFTDRYDKLVIATGAVPFIPDIPGIDSGNVFLVRNVRSADKIKMFIAEKNPRRAMIVGGGFIGLEMAENLKMHGIDITLVEASPHVMPSMDADMSVYIEEHLLKNGVTLYTGEQVKEISDDGETAITNKGSVIETDMIIVAAG